MSSHLTPVFLALSCSISQSLASGLDLGASLAKLSSRANVTSQGESSWFGWCGNTHYYGAPTPHRKWDDCVVFCEEFQQEAGLSYYQADAQEQEEWECVKEMMTTFKENFRPDKSNHYWLGGSRTEEGEIKWLSGEPLSFTDWHCKHCDDNDNPYIHLTAKNLFQWNMKDDQKDRNNGCVCKSYQQ